MENVEQYTPIKGYKQSKLCNILFSNYLSKHLKEQGHSHVGVYSVSPGIVLTNLGRYAFKRFSSLKKTLCVLFYPVIWYFMRSPTQGATTTLYCCLSSQFDIECESGFYRDCKKTELFKHARNESDEKKLWVLSEKFVSKWLD